MQVRPEIQENGSPGPARLLFWVVKWSPNLAQKASLTRPGLVFSAWAGLSMIDAAVDAERTDGRASIAGAGGDRH